MTTAVHEYIIKVSCAVELLTGSRIEVGTVEGGEVIGAGVGVCYFDAEFFPLGLVVGLIFASTFTPVYLFCFSLFFTFSLLVKATFVGLSLH